MRVAFPVAIDAIERMALEQLSKQSGRGAARARIVLLAAEGLRDDEIAANLGMSPKTVALWRKRFGTFRTDVALSDARLSPRPRGKPRRIDNQKVHEVLQMTKGTPPSEAIDRLAKFYRTEGRSRLQPDRWSTRLMAFAAGISEASVRRIWRKHGIKPEM